MECFQVKGKVLERRAAMEAAVAAEDYQRAAQERDQLDSLLLTCRRLELVQGEATRRVKYKLGAVACASASACASCASAYAWCACPPALGYPVCFASSSSSASPPPGSHADSFQN